MTRQREFVEMIPGYRFDLRCKSPSESTYKYWGSYPSQEAALEDALRQASLFPAHEYIITETRVLQRVEASRTLKFDKPIDALRTAVSLLQSCTDDEFDEEGWAEVAKVTEYLENYLAP